MHDIPIPCVLYGVGSRQVTKMRKLF